VEGDESRKEAPALQGGCGTTLRMLLTHPDFKPLFERLFLPAAVHVLTTFNSIDTGQTKFSK
jgi:hypothetical protein